jgi:hypothetical protein
MYRTTLILLDHIRSPLKLVGEGFDDERRGLERRALADPGNLLAKKRFQVSMQRGTPKPDNEHHWRWNGKGWYTRPDWNDGRCPPNSEPTSHNSCLPQKGHKDYHPDDHAQYLKSSSVTYEPSLKSSDFPANRYYFHTFPSGTYSDPGQDGDIFKHSRRYHSKSADSVDWDHEDGPQLRRKDFDDDDVEDSYYDLPPEFQNWSHPLPSDPAHLPDMTVGPELPWPENQHDNVSSYTDAKGLARDKEKLRQHYLSKGYHGSYIDQSMKRQRGRYQNNYQRAVYDSDPVSQKIRQRIPRGPERTQALRRFQKSQRKKLRLKPWSKIRPGMEKSPRPLIWINPSST